MCVCVCVYKLNVFLFFSLSWITIWRSLWSLRKLSHGSCKDEDFRGGFVFVVLRQILVKFAKFSGSFLLGVSV